LKEKEQIVKRNNQKVRKKSKTCVLCLCRLLAQRALESSLKDLTRGDAFKKLLLSCMGCKQRKKIKQS